MKKIFTLVAALFLAGNMFANDVYLSSAGNDANTGTEAAPVKTLAKAFELVEDWGTIHVSGMIAVDQMLDDGDEGGKHITLIGTSPETDGFDGQHTTGIARFWNKTTKIYNLAFVNANKEGNGGAIEVGGGAEITIDNCVFTGNEASEDGGALRFVDVANVTVKNTKIYNNRGHRGGGFQIFGGGIENVQILSCAIVNNEGVQHAGGVHAVLDGGKAQTIVFAGTTVAENKCAERGGAIWVDGSSNENTSLKFINCTVANNYSNVNAGNCGGISFWGFPCAVEFDNCIVAGNTSKDHAWGDIYNQSTKIQSNNSFIGSYVTWDADEAAFQASAVGSIIGLDGNVQSNHGMKEMTEDLYYPVFFLAETATMGDPALAEGYVDQLGNEIGKVVGAVQTLDDYVGQGIELPGTFDAANFDLGGDGVSFQWGNVTNGRFTSPSMDGGHHIGETSGGDWVNYTVDVKQAGAYDITVNYADGAADHNAEIAFCIGETNLTGTLECEPSGENAWGTYVDKTFENAITLPEGKVTLTLMIVRDPLNIHSFTFTYNEAATAIKSVNTTADGKWYNLQGVEVVQPTKGIFIHNGKKVIK